MHGDSLCTDDREYMKVRELLRSDAFQADFLSKPVEQRLAFAQNARKESQAHTSSTAVDIMDVNAAAVKQTMEAHGVKTLIHGHTHRPACHDIELAIGPAKRWVLGDWDKQTGWRITSDASGLQLEQFTFDQVA